jgi:hypothetical protein
MIAIFFKILILAAIIISFQSCGQSSPATINDSQQVLFDSIARQLVTVISDDQKYRNGMSDIMKSYGSDSKEMKSLLKKMHYADSINLLKVSMILDSYGWLGSEAIGVEGNRTLFMVIQHSPLKDQEKYLPVMRLAVKDGKAEAGNLALLEDRVSVRKGKRQIFGSQVSWNLKTNVYYVLPLEDPDNVDKRRAAMGLIPLADYLMDCCNLIWDVEAYKNNQKNDKDGNKE